MARSTTPTSTATAAASARRRRRCWSSSSTARRSTRSSNFTADDMLRLFGAKLTPNRQKCCLLSWRVLQSAIYSPVGGDVSGRRHAGPTARNAMSTPPRTALDPERLRAGFSDPLADAAPADDRRAAGLSRQRRQHAAAAAGDRGARRRLRAALRQRPSRHPLAQRTEHRAVRRSPREGPGVHRRRAARGSDLHPRHDRGHQPRRPQLGRRQPASRATKSCSPRWSTTRTSSPGSNCAERTGAVLRHIPITDDGLLGPRRCSTAAHASARSSSPWPPSRTCWARSTRSPRSSARRMPPARWCWSMPPKACRTADRRAGAGRRLPRLQRPQDARAHRASASSTAAENCSTRCRRSWAAAA